MINHKQWVVLFGGAGREASVECLFTKGVEVQAIIVPARGSARLEQAVNRLKALPCKLIVVEKSELADTLKQYAGKALLSIGFPFLIPGDLLSLFQPALNLHPTLLPRYRGPTTAAYILINNESESGSTIHYMTEQMDRGDIVAQSRVALTPFDTIRSLQRKVYASEPQLITEALAVLEGGGSARPQDESQASEFPKKRTPDDSEIDSSQPLIELINHIRASDADDFPAFFYYLGQKVYIKLWRESKSSDELDEI